MKIAGTLLMGAASVAKFAVAYPVILAVIFVVGLGGGLSGCKPSGDDWIAGIDISHHQSPLDWDAVKRDGIRFVYVKATEGVGWNDEHYRRYDSEARSHGLVVGAYHFFSFCADGKQQAIHFLEKIDLRPGDLPPVVDVEAAGNCDANPDADSLRRSLADFHRVLIQATGREPVIYTTQYFHWKYFREGFGNSPFWIRNLFMCPEATGRTPLCQYRVFPIRGSSNGQKVDRNAFRGGEAEFVRFLYRP